MVSIGVAEPESICRMTRKALMRIEVEHMSHGGVENGKLPVTYRQLEKWGVRRHSVASGVRELVALGIIEITRRGYSGAADMRAPNLYRLTYLQAWNAKDTGTHEYLRIGSVEQAEGAGLVSVEGRRDADEAGRGSEFHVGVETTLAPAEDGRSAPISPNVHQVS